MQQPVRYTKPAGIERESMRIITAELAVRGIEIPQQNQAVVHRVIHATADFDYAQNLRFTPDAVQKAVAYLRAGGAQLVTDTNMALAGVSKAALAKLGAQAACYMGCEQTAALAAAGGTTRAVASMQLAAQRTPGAMVAVGNAPTALLALCRLMEETGLRPAAVVAAPVGFVNVEQSKQQLLACCERCGVPAIVAMGRKGGSTVAAAVCNALIYEAAGMLDPAARGWQ